MRDDWGRVSYKTETTPRRTADTFKPSTDTCEVVFLVKNTTKRKVAAENELRKQNSYCKTKFAESSKLGS